MEDDRINWNSRAQSGETEETREVIRRYLPMREYEIEANQYQFVCDAEVDACGKRDEDFKVSSYHKYTAYCGDDYAEVFADFLDSFISRTGPTWRELIEREICRQAAELPGWKNEYKED